MIYYCPCDMCCGTAEPPDPEEEFAWYFIRNLMRLVGGTPKR